MTSSRQGNDKAEQDIFSERYKRRKGALSPSYQRVAAFIDTHRIDVLTSSALELARAIGTSDATVVRAVQALGFDGLHDLRNKLAATLGGRNAPAENLARTWSDVGDSVESAMNDVLASLADALVALGDPIVRSAMHDAVEILHVAERIVLFGVGPTAHIAAYCAARLRRKGRKQLMLDRTGSSLADQLLDLRAGDVLLMLAYGNFYQEAEAVLLVCQRLKLPVILVTDQVKEKPVQLTQVVLHVPRGRAGRVALHSTTVACLEMLLLGLAASGREAAINALMELERLREVIRSPRRGQRV